MGTNGNFLSDSSGVPYVYNTLTQRYKIYINFNLGSVLWIGRIFNISHNYVKTNLILAIDSTKEKLKDVDEEKTNDPNTGDEKIIKKPKKPVEASVYKGKTVDENGNILFLHEDTFIKFIKDLFAQLNKLSRDDFMRHIFNVFNLKLFNQQSNVGNITNELLYIENGNAAFYSYLNNNKQRLNYNDFILKNFNSNNNYRVSSNDNYKDVENKFLIFVNNLAIYYDSVFLEFNKKEIIKEEIEDKYETEEEKNEYKGFHLKKGDSRETIMGLVAPGRVEAVKQNPVTLAKPNSSSRTSKTWLVTTPKPAAPQTKKYCFWPFGCKGGKTRNARRKHKKCTKKHKNKII